MPDVFEILKQDHDEVKMMLVRLDEGQTARNGATAGELAHRKRLVDDLIIAESMHEAAEQLHFWPAVRALGADGERVAQEALEQETEGERVLDRLSKLDPGHPEFEEMLTGFASDARAHIAYEEAHAWPLLSTSITAEQSHELGSKIAAAKRLAPTRPHPGTPPDASVLKAVSPVAGAIDRFRDALTGRGRHS
jgi:hypothetical protein